MTSTSSSRPSAPRRLAVYQVPPPPPGWEGDDLVRIVDPLGLGAAWLSTARAGSVIAIHLRAAPDGPWEVSIAASDHHPVLRIESGGDHWHLLERDPVSAIFATDRSDSVHRIAFEQGDLVATLPVGTKVASMPGAGMHVIECSTETLDVRMSRTGP